MSSRNYTVTVKLKGDAQLSALAALTGGGGAPGVPPKAGGGGGGGSFTDDSSARRRGSGKSGGGGLSDLALGILGITPGKYGGVTEGLLKLGSSQLLKLTGIGLGVSALVIATVKSSAILAANLKLWEKTFLLVLKPFGDFIGMLFRPLTILMLQYAVQFYKVAGKWFIDAGKNAGNALADRQAQTSALADTQAKQFADFIKNLQDRQAATSHMADTQVLQVTKFFQDAGKNAEQFGKNVQAFIDNMSAQFTQIPGKVLGVFGGLGDKLWQSLQLVPGQILGVFGLIGSQLWSTLQLVPGQILGIFGLIGTSLYSTLSGVPDAIYNVFTSVASDIASKLSNVGQMILDAISRAISSVVGGRGPTLSPQAINNNNGTRTQMALMAQSVNP